MYFLVIFEDGLDYTWNMGPVILWSAIEPTIGVVTACMTNMLPLYYWAYEHIRSLCRREGRTRTGPKPTTSFHHSRLPTYIENNLVLRPKEDDEIRLTTMATAARQVSEESFAGNGIVVRSEVTQTVEECRRVRSF